MINFELSERQQRLRREFQDLGETVDGVPAAPGQFFTDGLWRRLGASGLLALTVPQEQGGRGGGALDTALALEGFALGCPDMGLTFSAAAHLLACTMPIVEFGSAGLRDRYVSGLSDGRLVGANAITEEGAGSDVAGLQTCAVRDGDEYILEGDKTYVTNGPYADLILVYAVTNPTAGYLGTTAFVVTKELAGVTRQPAFAKHGLESAAAGWVTLRDCRVPATHVLGKPGQGAIIFRRSMLWERSCLFAAYLGLMERIIAQSVEHARTRKQFGKPIGKYQAISHRLVDMRLQLESARWLVYRACWLIDQGHGSHLSSSLAKLAASEAAVSVAEGAVRIFGGSGVLREVGIGRHLWDAVPALTFSGTSEMMREVAASEMGL
jgi:alkylation response protein AidB-like acyl-CoA dehydrogenase